MIARLLGPGGIKSGVAETLLLQAAASGHELLSTPGPGMIARGPILPGVADATRAPASQIRRCRAHRSVSTLAPLPHSHQDRVSSIYMVVDPDIGFGGMFPVQTAGVLYIQLIQHSADILDRAPGKSRNCLQNKVDLVLRDLFRHSDLVVAQYTGLRQLCGA